MAAAGACAGTPGRGRPCGISTGRRSRARSSRGARRGAARSTDDRRCRHLRSCTPAASYRFWSPAAIAAARPPWRSDRASRSWSIVLRYDALAYDSPIAGRSGEPALRSRRVGDRAAPLYASDRKRRRAYPGPALSDRGLSPTGSLLIDDGAPELRHRLRQLAVRSDAGALRTKRGYRARRNRRLSRTAIKPGAASSISIPFGERFQLGGRDAGQRRDRALLKLGSDSSAVVVGSFSNDEESRQRGDLTASWLVPAADQSLTIAGGQRTRPSISSPELAGTRTTSRSPMRRYSDPSLANLYVIRPYSDRGSYHARAATYPDIVGCGPIPASTRGIHSVGPVSVFADFGLRSSTGSYDAVVEPYRCCRGLGAIARRKRAPTPASTASGNDYDVTAGSRHILVRLRRRQYGVSQPAQHRAGRAIAPGTALSEPADGARISRGAVRLRCRRSSISTRTADAQTNPVAYSSATRCKPAV